MPGERPPPMIHRINIYTFNNIIYKQWILSANTPAKISTNTPANISANTFSRIDILGRLNWCNDIIKFYRVILLSQRAEPTWRAHTPRWANWPASSKHSSTESRQNILAIYVLLIVMVALTTLAASQRAGPELSFCAIRLRPFQAILAIRTAHSDRGRPF